MVRKEFERVSPESVGISSEDILALLDELEDFPNCEPHGLMILRHGKVCAEGWWAPYAKNIPQELFSMSKTYTATGVGIAYTEGYFDLDDPLVKYFPEYADLCDDPRGREITVRHVLMMSSGKLLERTDIAEWIPHFFAMKMAHDPGTVFEYSAEDTHMGVALVERVTGRRFEDYLGEKLCDKIGIDKSHLHWGHLLNGSVVGCGGLSATVEDSLRLMKLYLDGGVWEGERLLSEDWIAQATSIQIVPVIPESSAPGSPSQKPEPYAEEGVEKGYGFQTWINGGGIGGVVEANGGLGQCATAYLDLDMVVSFQESSERNGIDEGLGRDFVVARVKKMAKDQPLPENPEAYARLQRRLARLILEKPESQPHSPTAELVSGRRYVVQGNSSLTFRKPLWKHMVLCDPIVYMDGMKWFAFDFSAAATCRLTFFEMDQIRELTIGIDGMSRLNSYGNDRIPGIDQVLMDGYWVKPDTFRVKARWIQTCYAISLDFCFQEKEVLVTAAKVSGDLSEHPMRVTDYRAVCR
ncbi:serine hydrolase domain-containing protein [Hominifimenecus sp. rT4P-3]|uniref:serine hydrolase domain-containing protein n=1 Tax=Hominifimenecus sp. rT4P-3 TaxID=3242979 RepID=UPI003DA68DBB